MFVYCNLLLRKYEKKIMYEICVGAKVKSTLPLDRQSHDESLILTLKFESSSSQMKTLMWKAVLIKFFSI